MDSIEQLKAKQAKELAKLETEHAIASLCPLPPRSVMEVSTGERAWITYDVTSLWEALDILAKFEPLAFHKFKGTYTRFETAAINDKRTRDKGEETAGPFLALIDVSQGEGFGPSIVFAFYAKVGDDICKIRCDYGYGHGGQYGASFRANPGGSSRRLHGNRYINGDFVANAALAATAESYIRWATGSRENANFGYAFGADYMDDETGVAGYDIDAIYRLENLARGMHQDRDKCIIKDEHADGGKRLYMADGSVWFHPYAGGAPTCEVTSTR